MSVMLWWLAAAALSIAAIRSAARRGRYYVVGPPGGGWADSDAPRRIRALAAPIEALARWPGLGDFLAAVAWTESRGASQACNTSEQGWCADNSARGWFQIRPDSARVAQLGLGSDALLDEPTAVALAAWYAHRLRPYARPGQQIDWLALRRGWALPAAVADVQESRSRSRATRSRFEEGARKAGMTPDFLYAPAFDGGYAWPGIDAVLGAVGRGKVAA